MYLEEHVVLSNKVTSHGVQATTDDDTEKQVHHGLDAQEVQHCRIKAEHHAQTHHIRHTCTVADQASSDNTAPQPTTHMLYMPRCPVQPALCTLHCRELLAVISRTGV